jgi:hypothetical protein
MAPRRLSGPVQRAALQILRDRDVVSTSEIMAVTHPRQLNPQYRSRSLRRVLPAIATRVGRADGMGRPVLWKLRPELEDHDHERAISD